MSLCRLSRFRKKQINRFSSELKQQLYKVRSARKTSAWKTPGMNQPRFVRSQISKYSAMKKTMQMSSAYSSEIYLLHLLGCWLATTFSFTQELQRNQYDDLPQSEITVLHKHILPSWMWFSRWNELIGILLFRYQNSEDRVYVKRAIRNFETRFVDRFWETRRR